MKPRVNLITKLAVGALLSSTAWAMPALRAQAADMPVKAMTPADAGWWFSGEVESGYRFFLNNPQDHRQTSNAPTAGTPIVGAATFVPPGIPGVQGNSLAKYYEYSSIKPGVFGNALLAFGTKNGVWKIETGGKNIG